MSTDLQNAMASKQTIAFFNLARHPLKFRLFLLRSLPSAYFAGVRIKSIDASSCRVTVPYKWFTRNPFRSTYFACLSMAAEMSTGALAMGHLYKSRPAVSMLVVKVESEYFKKAVGKISFLCEDGLAVSAAIGKAIESNEPQTIRVRSTGTDLNGDIVAVFFITWSFKMRSRK
jgi:hypothetical protein